MQFLRRPSWGTGQERTTSALPRDPGRPYQVGIYPYIHQAGGLATDGGVGAVTLTARFPTRQAALRDSAPGGWRVIDRVRKPPKPI
jgi:hypothetical protein